MQNCSTDRFAVVVVGSSGQKEAQVQSYSPSPGGANVPSCEGTLMIDLAATSAGISVTKESVGLTRLDGKRPDGLTLIP